MGSVPYDRIAETTALRRLYLWDPLLEFIQAVLGKPRLFRLADPLGALSINVFTEGGQHAWHYDESAFTVTLMLQSAETGGHFETLPNLRGKGADEGTAIRRLLEGSQEGVQSLPFTEGSLFYLCRQPDPAPGQPHAGRPPAFGPRAVLQRRARPNQ